MENLGYNRVLFILIIFLIPFLLTAQSKLGFEIRSSFQQRLNGVELGVQDYFSCIFKGKESE